MIEDLYAFKHPVKQVLGESGGRKSDEIWYAARVRIGAEENVRQRCREQISSKVVKDCYVFYYEEKRHLYGEWIVQEKVLFPGYVFLVSDGADAKVIDRELWQIKSIIRLLEMDSGVAALDNEEADFLMRIGGCRHTVGFSEGIIEQSKVRVYSGPLVGKEKYIRKIDRHKRKAFLEIPIFGEKQGMQVGLEIAEKR